MNMQMQLIRGLVALVLFASVGGWAVTHRVSSTKPATTWMQKTIVTSHANLLASTSSSDDKSDHEVVDADAQ